MSDIAEHKHALELIFEHVHHVYIFCLGEFLELEHMATLYSVFLFHLQIDVFLKTHFK